MRYRNDEDNRYRVNFMVATEELMDAMTVKQFISYLEENAEFEDNDTEYIDGKIVVTKVYCLHETETLSKEFFVTEDGRVFYWLSLIRKLELVDKEPKMKVEQVDFREVKDTVREVVSQLSVEDPNWSWKADVLKSEIRVWWGYLQYCDKKDNHFTIKMSDRPEESDTEDFMVARNEDDEYMYGSILGNDVCSDGNLAKCVEMLLRSIASIAHSRY